MRTRSSILARQPRPRIVLAATLALVLVLAGLLAACGDDEGAGTSEAATAAPEASATSTAEAAESTTDADTSEPASPSESEATQAATTPTPSISTGDATTTAGPERPVAIYLVQNERVSPVRRYVDPAAPARPALEALLAGPTAEDGGRTTAIPAGTRLLGVSIDGDGVLTADLSEEFTSGGGSLSMKLRAAQVVYTATQFPTVASVRFAVNGEPLETLGGEGLIVDTPQTRADYEDETPAVLIEEPLPNDAVHCPARARGTSNVFEATSLMAIAPPGELTTMPTDPTVVTATSGTGTRGTFDVEVPCPAGAEQGEQSLVSWWDSAKDGSPQGVETIPIQLVP